MVWQGVGLKWNRSSLKNHLDNPFNFQAALYSSLGPVCGRVVSQYSCLWYPPYKASIQLKEEPKDTFPFDTKYTEDTTQQEPPLFCVLVYQGFTRLGNSQP